jgi:hypothetical protein
LPHLRNLKFFGDGRTSKVASNQTCQQAAFKDSCNEGNMLTRLITASYAWLLEVTLWVSLALAGIAGYNATMPILQALGASPSPELTWKMLGACALIGVVFLLLAVITGPLLILLDVRQAVRSIEAKLVSREGFDGSWPTGRREPTI